MIGALCPGVYGVVVNAVPVEQGSDCRPRLTSGTGFTLLRGGRGDHRPAVLTDSTFTIGTPPETTELATGADPTSWQTEAATLAEPAA